MTTRNIDRVEESTRAPHNQKIQDEMQKRLRYYANFPDEIPSRLRKLEKEWDIERTLGTTSAGLSLAGLAAALFHKKWWLYLPLTVQAFYLQHSLQGWCPPLPLLRKLGVRTMREILEERDELIQILSEHRGRPQPMQPTKGGPAFDSNNRTPVGMASAGL